MPAAFHCHRLRLGVQRFKGTACRSNACGVQRLRRSNACGVPKFQGFAVQNACGVPRFQVPKFQSSMFQVKSGFTIRSLILSLSRSLAPSLPRSPAPSLSCSLAPSLSRSPAPSLPRSPVPPSLRSLSLLVRSLPQAPCSLPQVPGSRASPFKSEHSGDPDSSVGRFKVSVLRLQEMQWTTKVFPLLPVGIGGVAFHEARMKWRGGSLPEVSIMVIRGHQWSFVVSGVAGRFESQTPKGV
jgi:hypothetical protein